jgi:hypothetical protein
MAAPHSLSIPSLTDSTGGELAICRPEATPLRAPAFILAGRANFWRSTGDGDAAASHADREHGWRLTPMACFLATGSLSASQLLDAVLRADNDESFSAAAESRGAFEAVRDCFACPRQGFCGLQLAGYASPLDASAGGLAGRTARLHGLQSRPELNGLLCAVGEYDRGHYAVAIDSADASGEELISVKMSCLVYDPLPTAPRPVTSASRRGHH